jgi:hypothetical protein
MREVGVYSGMIMSLKTWIILYFQKGHLEDVSVTPVH